MKLLDVYLRSLRRAVSELARVGDGLEDAEAKISADRDLSAEGKAQQLAEARARAERKLDELREEVAEDAAYVENATVSAFRVATVSDADLDRAWARTLRQLDAGVTAEAVVSAAAEAREVATLLALRSELGPYLLAARAASREPGRQVPQVDVDRFGEAIDRALVEALPPEEGAVLAARLESRDLVEAARTQMRVLAKRLTGTFSPRDRLAAGYASADASTS